MLLHLFAAFCIALVLAAGGSVRAADCADRQSAGFRVLVLDSGRKVAVWYPAAAPEQPHA